MEVTQTQITADTLRNLRKEKNLSQKQLAVKSGIHYVTINRAEKTNKVNQKTMQKIYESLQN